jgi:hypothetical protein
MKTTGEELVQLWEVGHDPNMAIILDCHKVAKDDPAAANLPAMGDDLLVKLLIKNGIDPDGVVRQHLNNFIAHAVGKYERGECRRVERLRDIVQQNPILRGEM